MAGGWKVHALPLYLGTCRWLIESREWSDHQHCGTYIHTCILVRTRLLNYDNRIEYELMKSNANRARTSIDGN